MFPGCSTSIVLPTVRTSCPRILNLGHVLVAVAERAMYANGAGVDAGGMRLIAGVGPGQQWPLPVVAILFTPMTAMLCSSTSVCSGAGRLRRERRDESRPLPRTFRKGVALI